MARGALPRARRPRHQHRAPDARRPRQRPALRQPHDRHGNIRRADREALRYRVPPLRPQRPRRGAQAAEPRLQPLPPAFRRRPDVALLMRAALLAIGWGWAATIVWLLYAAGFIVMGVGLEFIQGWLG